MRLGMINSAWAQAGRDTAWGIRKTAEIGFDSIDIFADPLDIDARERKLIRVECEKAGLPIISVACVAVGLSVRGSTAGWAATDGTPAMEGTG